MIWEVEQDVGKLHIPVDDIEPPDIFDPVYQFTHYKSCLLLPDSFTRLEEHAEVESIAVVHEHVDI